MISSLSNLVPCTFCAMLHTCCTWWTPDVLHVICPWLYPGHLSIHVGDSLQRSEDPEESCKKNLELHISLWSLSLLLLKWQTCQMSGIIRSVLGLVGLVLVNLIIIIIIIINLIYIAQFDTNGILTALYLVITYILQVILKVCSAICKCGSTWNCPWHCTWLGC